MPQVAVNITRKAAPPSTRVQQMGGSAYLEMFSTFAREHGRAQVVLFDQPSRKYEEHLGALIRLGILQAGTVLLADNIYRDSGPAMQSFQNALEEAGFASQLTMVRRPYLDQVLVATFQPDHSSGGGGL